MRCRCGGTMYTDLRGVKHCVRCEATADTCPACGGRGYREIRNKMQTCKWCEGTGAPAVSVLVDAGEGRR